MKILIILVLVIAIIAMVIYALMDMFVPREEKPKEHYPLIKLDDDDDDNYPKIVEHEFFVTKDSGYYVSVWPRKDRLGICQFEIAGMYYRERIEEYCGEFVGTLEAEPDNVHDPEAIKVLAPDGHHIGYVPRDMTAEVRKATSLPATCYCFIGRYNDAEGTHFYSCCYIEI